MKYLSKQRGEVPYALSFEYTEGNEQEPIALSPYSSRAMFTLSFADGGAAKLQTTTNTIAEIEADTAVWVDWSLGSISTTRQDWFFAPTAVRVYRDAGTVLFSIKDLGD